MWKSIFVTITQSNTHQMVDPGGLLHILAAKQGSKSGGVFCFRRTVWSLKLASWHSVTH